LQFKSELDATEVAEEIEEITHKIFERLYQTEELKERENKMVNQCGYNRKEKAPEVQSAQASKSGNLEFFMNGVVSIGLFL
jgi:hypothetical protein